MGGFGLWVGGLLKKIILGRLKLACWGIAWQKFYLLYYLQLLLYCIYDENIMIYVICKPELLYYFIPRILY